MVSNARLDLPEPERPVTTTSRSRGISSEMFFRLWTRAPWTAMVVRAAERGLPANSAAERGLPADGAAGRGLPADGAAGRAGFAGGFPAGFVLTGIRLRLQIEERQLLDREVAAPGELHRRR